MIGANNLLSGLHSITSNGIAAQTRYFDGSREVSKAEYEQLATERYPNRPETSEQRIERWLREAGCTRSASGWQFNGHVMTEAVTTLTDAQLNAFVSLIVEECASICTGPGYEDSMVGIELALAIRERFKP